MFRLSRWALDRLTLPGLRIIVNALGIVFQKFIEVLTGISIPARCNIGSGLYIGHFGGIFIDSDCRLGENCNLAQGVTIGKGGRGELQGVPILGDRVHVGANALILGKVTIGDDAVIGPGAVVMSSVPPCGMAMGNPARVIGWDGSFELVHYDNMENDPARKLVLKAQEGVSGRHRQTAVAEPLTVARTLPPHPEALPRGDGEPRRMERVIQLISQIGGIDSVPPEGEIYGAGFSSVRVLELLLALEEEFGIKIPDKDFITARTPRDISGLIQRLQVRQPA